MGCRQTDQLGQRERRRRRPTPRRHDDFPHLRVTQRCERSVGDVGPGQTVRVAGEDPRDVEGDVAVADHHDGFRAQVDWQIGEVGVAVDPGHQLGRGAAARQTHPLDVQATIIGRTNRVEHGVVMLGQFGEREVLADLDVEEERESRQPRHLVEQLGDPLGGLMIGSDAGTHQPVRRRQLLEDVHDDAALCQQFVRGVHGCRPGADDGDGQGTTAAVVHHGRLQHRRELRRRGQLSLTLRVERRIEFDEHLLVLVEFGIGRDGADGTRADTRAAVHARHGIDVEHLGGREPRLVRRRVDAVDRAGVDTGPVAATRLGDYVGHVRLRDRHQVLTLRLAAVAAGLAVDPADPPHQLGDRIHQAGVLAQHPDVTEHVAQHLS